MSKHRPLEFAALDDGSPSEDAALIRDCFIALSEALLEAGVISAVLSQQSHAALMALGRLEAAEADKQLLREERNLYLGDRDEARSLLAAAEADARQKAEWITDAVAELQAWTAWAERIDPPGYEGEGCGTFSIATDALIERAAALGRA